MRTEKVRYLLDLSAWARSSASADRWQDLLERDQLICHPVFAIESLHNAINARDYAEQRADLEDGFDWVHPDGETTEIALRMQERMASADACGQRVKSADLLIAALAVQAAHGVIHYDADYDLIRDFGGEAFESEWIAERGTLESEPTRVQIQRKAFRSAFGERMIQLQDDTDLELWPNLLGWLDEQLRDRGLPTPGSPR